MGRAVNWLGIELVHFLVGLHVNLSGPNPFESTTRRFRRVNEQPHLRARAKMTRFVNAHVLFVADPLNEGLHLVSLICVYIVVTCLRKGALFGNRYIKGVLLDDENRNQPQRRNNPGNILLNRTCMLSAVANPTFCEVTRICTEYS